MVELKIVFNLSDSLIAEHGEVDYIDLCYKMDKLKQQPKAIKQNNKIGVFDLETFKYSEKNDGSQKVYSCGFAVDKILETYYLGDKSCSTTNDLKLYLL